LKNWVETEKLTLRSKNLVNELHTFVSRGTTFKAKEGETDDLVMALITAIRMIETIAVYDEDIFDDIKSSFEDEDDYGEPMPIGIL
jgi:hypothetical protein